MNSWQFKDPPNVAVIVNKKILSGEDWIAYVSHDAHDGGWQFHGTVSAPPREADAAVVSLYNIVTLDATVVELADLPPGWHASRPAKGSAWTRERNSD